MDAINADDVFWWMGALVATSATVSLVVWLVLGAIDQIWPRIHRRYLRWWRGRRDHGLWLSVRYRLGARLLRPLVEKQYHAYDRAMRTARDDGNEGTADHREWMKVALSSLMRSARGS